MIAVAAGPHCTGRIDLGPLAPDTAARLSRIGAEWLDVDGGAIIVRHIHPGGPPAVTAVPSELIVYLDALTPEERDGANGTLTITSRGASLLQLVITNGDLHICWPREDWSRATPANPATLLDEADPFSARVTGTIRMKARAGAETSLTAFVDAFEGLYPEGDLELSREDDHLRIELKDVNVGPAQLLATVRTLAAPPESLQADLDVGSFALHAGDRDFRLTVRDGVATALRPSLWTRPE